MTRHEPEKIMDNGKLNSHDNKAEIHNRDHSKHAADKAGERLERHGANGVSVREQPKKGGAGGKGTWGTWKDDM